MLRNVVSSLAQSLQELSTNFRHTQSGYLKRKGCSKAVFGLPEICTVIKDVSDTSYILSCLFCMSSKHDVVGLYSRYEES